MGVCCKAEAPDSRVPPRTAKACASAAAAKTTLRNRARDLLQIGIKVNAVSRLPPPARIGMKIAREHRQIHAPQPIVRGSVSSNAATGRGTFGSRSARHSAQHHRKFALPGLLRHLCVSESRQILRQSPARPLKLRIAGERLSLRIRAVTSPDHRIKQNRLPLRINQKLR